MKSFNECLSGICEKYMPKEVAIIPDRLNTEKTCNEKEIGILSGKACITDEKSMHI